MDLLIALLPRILSSIVVPEVAKLVRANPSITDDEIIAKLPADLQALCGKNQSFLDSIRSQSGRV